VKGEKERGIGNSGTFEKSKQLGVEYGRAKESEEKKPANTAIANRSQQVTISILDAVPDMLEDSSKLDGTSRCRSIYSLPNRSGHEQKRLPVLCRGFGVVEFVRVNLAISVFSCDSLKMFAQCFLQVFPAETLHVYIQRFGQEGVTTE
jgi:hypothetical protein